MSSAPNVNADACGFIEAYAGAFAGAAKDMLLPNEGNAR